MGKSRKDKLRGFLQRLNFVRKIDGDREHISWRGGGPGTKHPCS